MIPLQSVSFYIPRLWEKDWSDAISNTQGVDQQLLVYQARAASLLEKINDFKATPERLGWLSLWTKTFVMLDGAQRALESWSEYVLQLLERAAFESVIHVHTILEPGGSGAWDEVIERMRAHTAWCLWNDKGLYKELLDPQTQQGIWDQAPTLEIVNDLDERAMYERLFGPLEVEEQYALRRKQRQQVYQGDQAKRRVETWLAHPDLQLWTQRLESASRPIRSFFELLGENPSIPRRLSGLGMCFAYHTYKKGSLFTHGSTIDGLMYFHDDLLTPKFVSTEDSMEILAGNVGSSCDQAIFGLGLLQMQIWSNEEQSE